LGIGWEWGEETEDRRQETEDKRQEIKRLGVQKGGNVVLDRRVVIEHLAV
jgi:hypothetical protein